MPVASERAAAGLPRSVHVVLRTPGQPLTGDTRELTDSHFDHGSEDVRARADTEAANSSRSVNAARSLPSRHLRGRPVCAGDRSGTRAGLGTSSRTSSSSGGKTYISAFSQPADHEAVRSPCREDVG